MVARKSENRKCVCNIHQSVGLLKVNPYVLYSSCPCIECKAHILAFKFESGFQNFKFFPCNQKYCTCHMHTTIAPASLINPNFLFQLYHTLTITIQRSWPDPRDVFDIVHFTPPYQSRETNGLNNRLGGGDNWIIGWSPNVRQHERSTGRCIATLYV